MKNFFKDLWDTMTDPRYEKYILVILPCVAVLIAALILVPGFISRSRETALRDMEQEYNAAAGQSVKPEIKKPAETVKPQAEKTADKDKAEKNDSISNKPESGNTVSSNQIKQESKPSKTPAKPDNKPAQTPAVPSAKPSKPAKPAQTPTPQNNQDFGANSGYEEHVEHKEIENIADIVTIIDDTELSYEEQFDTSAPSAPESVEVEEIITPNDAMGVDLIVVENVPVLDANGNPTYEYEFNLGPNGRLVLNDSGLESDVYPVDENNDGVVDYGEYFFVPTTPEEGTESDLTAQGYYKSEILYNSDNTPVSKYSVTATPIMGEVTKRVGWQKIDGKMYYYNSNGEMVHGLKKIDGLFYYFDQNGVKASSVGIDVSSYNGNINWNAVKAQGIDFAIIRVGGRGWGSGVIYNDTKFSSYIKGAKEAGLKVGVYFYSTAINEKEAVEEASYTLQRVGRYSLDYPIFMDVEFSGENPHGRADVLSPGQRTRIINAFCETVENSGRQAGVYSGQNFFHSQLEINKINSYFTWLASYTANNRLPDFRGRYDMWQFTSSGKINGIGDSVDLNVIF